MKYTRSGDGIERATINIPLRLTREQYAELTKDLQLIEGGSIRSYFETVLHEHIAFDLADRVTRQHEDNLRRSEEKEYQALVDERSKR